LTVERHASRLFDEEGDWIGLVEQAQFAAVVIAGGWIEKDASLDERAVDVRHHGTDVSRDVAASQGPAAESLEETHVTRRKAISEGLVDRVILALLRHAHILVAEQISADGRVQRKTVYAVAYAIDQHGR